MRYLILMLLLTGCVKKTDATIDAIKASIPTKKERYADLQAREINCEALCKPYLPAYFSPTSMDCLCMAGDPEQ